MLAVNPDLGQLSPVKRPTLLETITEVEHGPLQDRFPL